MERILFLRKFLKYGLHIASITPSSRALSEAVVANINWERAEVIVELGAGTGPITEAILSRARPSCRVIAIERDPDFISVLKRRFAGQSNLEIVESPVRDLAAVLKHRGVEAVDYIVSGLPIPSFTPLEQRALFADMRIVLSEHGAFSQITEIPLIYWSFYKQFFENVGFKFVPWNIPPGGVYFCSGLKDSARS